MPTRSGSSNGMTIGRPSPFVLFERKGVEAGGPPCANCKPRGGKCWLLPHHRSNFAQQLKCCNRSLRQASILGTITPEDLGVGQ